MADSDTSNDDKQLAPSQRKLDKARSEGQIPRSRDIGHTLVLGAALLGFAGFGSDLGGQALRLVGQGLRLSRSQVLDPSALSQGLLNSGLILLSVVVPACLLIGTVGVIANGIPGGFIFTGKPINFNFGRVSPVKGLANIFSSDKLIDLIKLAPLATAMVGTASWYAIRHFDQTASLSRLPLVAALEYSESHISKGLLYLVGILVIAALIDVPLQWYRHWRSLKMTHQEAREEIRESEGDPQVRGRLRARQREIAQARMLAAVTKADVVITNPTHYAVAVRYDENGMGAPRVVAKGVDHMAAKIREVAMDAGVPMFEAPPLARALYAHVDLDREIPAVLYSAVAQVLAYIYQLRHYVPGRGRHPNAPRDLQVPPDLDPNEAAR